MSASSPVAKAYDTFPYPAHAYWRTHPDQLAVMATLFGMTPAPIDGCRVLELGCAVGGNLLPMAVSLPGSAFVGLDISAVQIAQAKEAGKALGLDNVTFVEGDLADLAQLRGGPFDYIVAHGVYSWVSAPLREAMMHGIRSLLSPSGVAYVSYNTLPGWYELATIRDLMRFHTEQFEDPETQIDQALVIAEWLAARANATPADARAAALTREVKSLYDRPRAGIAHEFLSETNSALLFRDFVGHAEAHGMRYLSDATPWGMRLENYDEDLQTLLHPIKGLIRQLQYIDFVADRRFRRTLLCRDDVTLNRSVSSSLLRGMNILAGFAEDPGLADLHGTEAPAVVNRVGAEIVITDPYLRLALATLVGHQRRAIPFETLVTIVRVVAKTAELPPIDDLAEHLASMLLKMVFAEVVRASTREVKVATTVTPRPETGALQRWQATRGSYASNLCHEHMPLDEAARRALTKLDGSQTREALAEELPRGLLERFAQSGFLVDTE